MQDYNIERIGLPNLLFTGDLIGQSGGGDPQIRIFRTKAAKFIGELVHPSNRNEADHFDKPADLVNWLKRKLSAITPAAQAAIEDAVKHDEAFQSYWTEKVE